MVLLAHRVPVNGMGMPLQAPAAVDVTVMSPQPEIQRADNRRDERDVGKRPADEVVTASRGPVEQVVQADRDGHAARLAAACDSFLPREELPEPVEKRARRLDDVVQATALAEGVHDLPLAVPVAHHGLDQHQIPPALGFR